MALEENKVLEMVKKNFEYIMRKHNMNQNELAKEVHASPGRMTDIMNMHRLPTLYPFWIHVKERFGYSIDEFLFTDIEAVESNTVVSYDVTEDNYKKIYGLYQLYYFSTATFKGREYADDGEALRCAVLLVCRKNFKTDGHRVVGIFDLRKEEADSLYRKIDVAFKGYNYDNVYTLLHELGKHYHIYEGNLELSLDHMYVSLQFGVKDKALMILHNHLGRTLHYRGGLGTLVSVSKGRSASPCMQYIGVSRASIQASKEEIAQHLLIRYPSLRTYDATEKVVDMVIDLYCAGEGAKEKNFTPEVKKMMVRTHVDKIINETVEKNLFRSASVTSEDDDEWYHYLKRVNDIQ